MDVVIRAFTSEDLQSCARLAASSSLKDVYGFTEEGWLEKLSGAPKDENNLLFVAWVGDRIAGFAWVHVRGAFLVAPYLRFIAVDPLFQGFGIGKCLLDEFETKTKQLGRSYFLLVSDFNTGAQHFYEKQGYRRIGELKDFVVPGVQEIIMVKPNRAEKI